MRPAGVDEDVMPFECELRIEGARGSVAVRSSWDEGALESIMCSRVYERLRADMGKLRPSVKKFRLADGTRFVWWER